MNNDTHRIKQQQVIPIPITRDRFFRFYLELLKDFPPFNKLAARERKFISLLMSLKSQHKNLPKDERNALIFSKVNKDKIREELGDKKPLGEGTLNNMLYKLRKDGIIINHYDIPGIIDITPDENFSLVFKFNVK